MRDLHTNRKNDLFICNLVIIISNISAFMENARNEGVRCRAGKGVCKKNEPCIEFCSAYVGHVEIKNGDFPALAGKNGDEIDSNWREAASLVW